MKKVILATMMLAVASTSAWSAVNLIAPADVRVMSIDAQDIKSGLLGTQQHEYKLDAGAHQIHVRYEQFFDHSHGGDHEIIKSDVVVIDTPELVDGEQYRLAVPKNFKDVEEARQFAKNPQIALYNQQGQMIAEQSAVQAKQPIFAGGLFSRSYDLTKKKSSTVATPVAKTEQKPNHNVSGKKGQQLIDLWQQSSASDREAFLIWLNQQR